MKFTQLETCKFCTNEMKALGGEYAVQQRNKNVHWYCEKCNAHSYASAIDAKQNLYEEHKWYTAAEWEAWVNYL